MTKVVMEKLPGLMSTTNLSTLPPTTATLAILTSILAVFLLPIIFRRRNWPDAPPGPVGWPVLGYLPHVTHRIHEDFFHLASTYGPVFSLYMGQIPTIVVSSPETIRDMFKQHDATFSSRTITEAVRCVAYDATSLVFVPYGSRWRLLRKTMTTELFSARAIELLQPARKQQVHGLLSTIYSYSKSRSSVNVAESLFIVSANLISNLVCSKNHFDNTVQGRELKNLVWEILESVGKPNVADLIPFLKVFDPQGLIRRVKKLAKNLDTFLEKLIDDRLEQRRKEMNAGEDKRLDLLDVALNYKSDRQDDEIKHFSKSDIKGILADMFIAGTDTSSSTVEWGMAEILKKPEIYKKIMEEMDQVVGRERFIEEDDIAKLTYFQAVVKEVFRLHPAVPLLIPRRADEACSVEGFYVPKHAMVFVNVWGMGRDPKLWCNPNEFNPDRFVGSEMDVKGQHFELLPFGTGRRSCVGMSLGHRMVHYFLASLLHAFEWEFPANILNDMTEKVGITLQKNKVLLGIPKARLRVSIYLT